MDASVLDDPEALKKIQESQRPARRARWRRLLVVSERYPELKATAAFRDLQAQLEGTENRITVARKRFVDSVAEYNKLVRFFPTNLTARFLLERAGAADLRGDGRRREAARGEVLSARRARSLRSPRSLSRARTRRARARGARRCARA